MDRKIKYRVSGILCLIFPVAVVGYLLWFFRSYIFLLMLGVLLGGTVLSQLALYRQKKDCSLRVRPVMPPTKVGRRTAIPIKIQVENKNRFWGFPMDITYQVENLFTGAVQEGAVHLWAGGGISTAMEQDLISQHLGRLELRITKVVLRDWMHLAALEWEENARAWTIAQPVGVDDPEAQLSEWVEHFPGENETRKRGIDINPDVEIREYIPGDELKSIHWKLTAKQGKTMVRERLASGKDVINLLLPLGQDEKENDALVDACQSLAGLLLEQGYPVRLCRLAPGNTLAASFLAELGELERALDEVLSVNGKQTPGAAQELMAAEFPGEAYVIVQNGAYKGAYIR